MFCFPKHMCSSTSLRASAKFLAAHGQQSAILRWHGAVDRVIQLQSGNVQFGRLKAQENLDRTQSEQEF